jgi:hypothetical protein
MGAPMKFNKIVLLAWVLFAILINNSYAQSAGLAVDGFGNPAYSLNTIASGSPSNVGNDSSQTTITGSYVWLKGDNNFIGTAQESQNLIGTFEGSINQIGGRYSQNTIGSATAQVRIKGTTVINNSAIVEGPLDTQIGGSQNAGEVRLQSVGDSITVKYGEGIKLFGDTEIGNFSGSNVVIGSANRDSTINFQGNRLQNVGNAVVGTDAVNLNQLNSAIGGVNSAISGLQNQMNSAKAGIAGVTAATNLPGLNHGQKYNFGVAWGNYMAYNGMALGGNARITENVTMKLSGSATSGVYSGGAGFAVGF